MKNSLVYIALLLLMIMFISECRIFRIQSNSKTSIADSSNDIVGSCSNRIFYASLILKNVSVNYNINGSQDNFKCSVKIVKDSLITLSISSLMGIEIFRIYVNRDSVYIIDRTSKSFIVKSLTEEISKYSDFLCLEKIQDLILGNVIKVSNFEGFQLLTKGIQYSKYGIVKDLNMDKQLSRVQIDYVINNKIRKPSEFSLRNNSDYFHLVYDDYKSAEGMLFPGIIGIEIKTKSERFIISLEIENLKIINNSFYHILIPDGYKRKT
jgi:hypothetical protein